MCGELYVGLSFIFPALFYLTTTTLRIETSELTAVRVFKKTVQQQLETRFRLDSGDLTQSIPIMACMLDPQFILISFQRVKEMLPAAT